MIDCANDGFTVRLPEDSQEDALEKLEDIYDELQDMDRDMTEQKDGDSEENIHAAGMNIQLKDGRDVYANVSPWL